MTMQLRMGNSAINAFKRLPYTPAYALAEFVDNSTQSFFTNREALGQSCVSVGIVFDRNARSITIHDDAYGMSLQDLDRALTVGVPPIDASGRSRYGMGMKTAACWFGSKWTLTSKQYGSNEEFEFSVDVDSFSRSEPNSSTFRTRKKARDLHYTTLTIENVSRQMSGTQINEWRKILGSIYRKDIQAGRLKLEVEHVAADYPGKSDEDFYLSALTGRRYKVDFDEVVPGCGVRIKGWIGVFAEDHGGRAYAGISVFQNDRCIMGADNSWRPARIFASGAGSTLNQKLVGELNLDDPKITVSHTKDQILWTDDQEDEIVLHIKKIADEHDIITMARRTYSADDADRLKRETAIAKFRDLASTKDFIDKIAFVEAPNKEFAVTRNSYTVDETRQMEPDFEIKIEHLRKKILVKLVDLSPNDPYYAYEITSDGDLVTIINTSHSGYRHALDAENPAFVYFLQCALDSFAEWRCQALISELVPESVKEIKDQILKYRPDF
jgi:Histidine kinase-, DNA gyrase B-, and HSP90-like ATPase